MGVGCGSGEVMTYVPVRGAGGIGSVGASGVGVSVGVGEGDSVGLGVGVRVGVGVGVQVGGIVGVTVGDGVTGAGVAVTNIAPRACCS